ncbi:MAG: hypothetical protein SFV19_06965 [Rhodospirillaceae bacterium]|nr:hypothetical protein [Rhodospirillaceae bacterium]
MMAFFLTERGRIVAALAMVTALLVGTGWFLRSWSDDERAQAEAFRSAIYDVEAAVGLVRRFGGALDPEATQQVLALYEKAATAAKAVSDPMLARIHRDLPLVWRDVFQKSTAMYVGALAVQDRDGARQAALLQDDWFRWYGKHKGELNLPEPSKP